MTPPSPGTPPPFPYAGELATLAAAVIWACTLSVYRRYARGLSAVLLNWFKNTVALVFLICCLALRWLDGMPPAALPGSEVIGWLLLSGLIGFVISDTALFAGLRRVGAQLTSALQSLVPPVAALLAWFFMGERLTTWGWAGMALTLVAVLGVIRTGPGSQLAASQRDWVLGVVCGVTSAVTQAVGFVIARHALQQVELLTGTLLRLSPAVVLLLPLALRAGSGWSVLAASPLQLGRLAAAAVCGGGVGLFLLAAGTKFAPVGVITTIGATLPIWVIPVSWLTLGERARPAQLAWTILAVAGVAMLFIGEN